MSEHGLRLEGIVKQVGGDTHLYGVDLELETGLTVLIGPTLAGKTSLLRLMAGLDRPTEGRVLVDGRDVTRAPVQKRRVAMVYQQFINYPSLSVYDNIASPLKLAGLDRAQIDRKVHEVAELLHIEALLPRLPEQLSGGQQQRTAIARALVKDADLLLFDEPLVNLDYKLREELRVEMRDIFERRDAIVVYATTEPVEALLLGGNAVVLEQGRVLQSGPTLDVYHQPASDRVGAIFSDPPMNMIPGRVADGHALLGVDIRVPLRGHLAGLRDGQYRFGARANHLSIARTSPEDVQFDAVVDLAEVNGSETFIHVEHARMPWVVQEEGVRSVASGVSIPVFIHPDRLYAFEPDGRLVAAPGRARDAA